MQLVIESAVLELDTEFDFSGLTHLGEAIVKKFPTYKLTFEVTE